MSDKEPEEFIDTPWGLFWAFVLFFCVMGGLALVALVWAVAIKWCLNYLF